MRMPAKTTLNYRTRYSQPAASRKNIKDKSTLNKRELDVLNILFASESEMTSTDICNVQRDLTQSTVIAVLRKLLIDGLVEVAGVTHSGKVLSRTYRPTPEAKAAVIRYFCQEIENAGAIFTIDELRDAVTGGEAWAN